MKNDAHVDCRLTLPDGTVIEFKLDGPLVAMPAKPKKGGRK